MSISMVPVGWGETRLEECLDFVLGGDWGKPPEFEDPDFCEVKCIRGSEFRNWKTEKGKTASLRKIKLNSLEKRSLIVGDILLEISGGGPDQPVGRTEVIDSIALSHEPKLPKVPTNFLRLMRPASFIDSKFLNYYLKNFYISGEVIQFQSGSNNLRNLQFKDYSKIEVPFPPLNEQTRIANKLDELLAQVDTIKARVDAIPAILKRFRQSVLAAAVSGKLTEEWREREGLSRNTWESAPLEDLIVEMRNGLSPKPNEDGKGNPILRISSVRSGYVDQKDIRYLECDEKVSLRYGLSEGDILFTRYNGSIDFVGVCGLIRKLEHETLLYPDKLIRVKVGEKLLAEYLEIYFSSSDVRKVVTDFVKSTSGQKGISGKDLKSVNVVYPKIEEQKQIVQRVEQLFAFADQIEQRVKDAQLRINNLTQSILAKAFRGELVPQDPNDEPASVLLERIKQEREEAAKLAKAAKKVGKRK